MDHHRRARLFFFLLIFFSLYSCSKKKPQVIRSYYFWRSSGLLTDKEKKFLADHQIDNLYVRVLDIDWDAGQGAIPVSEGQPGIINKDLNQTDSVTVNIIPVIFITNKTFERIDSSEIPVLAKRIIRRCLGSYDEEDKNSAGIKRFQPKEIQFDCDWTVSTRGKYFYFLEQLKALLPTDRLRVSATIRLHQYKYPGKTGIPPVSRGMLMTYNISDLRQHSPVNSIYDDKAAKSYFESTKKYPLPLDIALPAYSWCIIFRDQKFYQIENDLSETDLQSLSFLEKRRDGFYRVIQDTAFRDLYLRPGDEIKIESINTKRLQQAATLARQAVNTDQFAVSFFELSEKEIKNYSHETIENIYHSYQ